MQLATELLTVLGEDPNREGLQDTPRRFASMWREFIEYDAGKLDTAFEAITCDQLVIVSPIRVWSMCEHHLMPFWCDVSIGYIPHDKVLGLSKFARIAQDKAHQLQLQERLVSQIADEITALTGSPDVAVMARGEHLCMTMRGIKSNALMTSSVMRGVFSDNPAARNEFLVLTSQSIVR